jgi:NADH-quinone oxidoreductase subunit M
MEAMHNILGFPILSLSIFLPLLGALYILLFVRGDEAARWSALAVSVATFLVTLPLWLYFDTSTAHMQFEERHVWIEAFNIYYRLGIDGISMPFILLTSFLTVVCIISAWECITKRVKEYMIAFLVLETALIGVFAAMDIVLFYIFWEAMLLPMYLIIGVWGGTNRVYATIKFFLYTLAGSVLMLVALLAMYFKAGHTFDMQELMAYAFDFRWQFWIWIAFFFAFAVKVPMWPVHTWLPDAHVEAPTGGSVILAAIMLKIGGYGFLRFSLPITPDASAELDWLIITMSLTAVVYIGFVALVQRDMKKLIAYSSIAHMGFVTLGFFIVFRIINSGQGDQGAVLALEGGMVQMVSHGFISGAMFLCVGVMYDRMHSRQIADYGGVANTMPVFAAFMVFFAMANAGLPGTSGFVGEFMVILASFKASFWIAFLAALTLILGAAYTLWMVKRVIFGEIANDNVRALTDINKREFLFLSILAIAVLALGLWPDPLVDVMHATIENLLNHIANTKL